MGIFTIEPGLAIWTWITFAILFGLLLKFVFPTLLGNLREREELIAKSVDDARAVNKRLAEVEAEREQLLAATRREADGLLHQTRGEAKELQAKLARQAEDDAQHILTEARERLTDERQRAAGALRRDAADLICDAAEKVIQHAFLDDADRAWSRELAEKL